MSQKPFMWNRNNPYAYSDPSGYVWEHIDAALQPIIVALRQSPTFKASFDAAAKSPIKFTMSLKPGSDLNFSTVAPDPKRPGKAIQGTGYSLLTPSGPRESATSTILRDDIGIRTGSNATDADRLKAVAGEVFNAGQAANDPRGLMRQAFTNDDDYGNVAERVGEAGANAILQEVHK